MNFGDTWHQKLPVELLIIIFPANGIKQAFALQTLELTQTPPQIFSYF